MVVQTLVAQPGQKLAMDRATPRTDQQHVAFVAPCINMCVTFCKTATESTD